MLRGFKKKKQLKPGELYGNRLDHLKIRLNLEKQPGVFEISKLSYDLSSSAEGLSSSVGCIVSR